MWLGVIAIIVAISFALIKFLTTVHMRRLREQRLRLHNTLTKSNHRFSALEGKREVEKSTNGAVEQKLKTASRFKDDLYQRLLVELPDRLQGDLRACINRNPIPESRGVKLFHQLKLPEKITDALGAVSVAVLELPADDESTTTVLKGELIQALEKGEISYSVESTEDASCVICAFDTPEAGLTLVRNFVGELSPERAEQLRGALTSGAGTVSDPGDDGGDVSRLFARALDDTQHLAETAPRATLLLNEAAYEGVKKNRRGVKLFSKAEKLYAFTWDVQSAEGEEESPTDGQSAEGESPSKEAESSSTEESVAPVTAETPAEGDAGAQSDPAAPKVDVSS